MDSMQMNMQVEYDKLKKKQSLLLQIFIESPIPAFVIDANHVVTHYNRALEDLTGITAAQIVGTSNQWKAFYKEKRPVMADLLVDGAPESTIRHYYRDYYQHFQVASGVYVAEGFFEALGEKGKWLFFTATPLKNEKGEIQGAIETLQDISDRKRAEQKLKQSESRYRSLLDFSPYPIVVYDLQWNPVYINTAFTSTFGWTLKDSGNKKAPFSPQGMEILYGDELSSLNEKKSLKRRETQWLSRDGRRVDVVLRAATFLNSKNEAAGHLVILRDITLEKRLKRDNDAMLRISMALPGFRDLEPLLDYISYEIKGLLETEGALVILKDDETGDLYFKGAAYDDPSVGPKVKQVRFSIKQIVAGQVIETGEPVIINDTASENNSFPHRDAKLGYHTRNLIEVPLTGKTHIIGALASVNKKHGEFVDADRKLLSMIASTVSLSIENASISEALKKAFIEVKSLNRAKDKAINHLSHELRTPVSTLTGVMELLGNELKSLPDESWRPIMEIADRNLHRIVEIQKEVADIMCNTRPVAYGLIHAMVNSCADYLWVALKKAGVAENVLKSVRDQIDESFGPVEDEIRLIDLGLFLQERIGFALAQASHRSIHLSTSFDEGAFLALPGEAIRKMVDGLIKNAIENTPDEGQIAVSLKSLPGGLLLVVDDHGVGIIEEARRRIFEGFFTTRDTLYYSTKRPYDFNAGGKGADLLRIKIFAERYNFSLNMSSVRCSRLPLERSVCPGRISRCPIQDADLGCKNGSGTLFTVFLPKSE